MVNLVDDRVSAVTERNWRWMRVYYFEECKDSLILNGIWPAVRKVIARNGAQAYFERDWIGGPNILLGFNNLAAEGMERCAAEIREYVSMLPSKSQVSQAEFASRTKTLAVLESRRAEDSLRELQPNNTIVCDCEEPYSPLLKTGMLKDSVRHFLCRSSDV